MNPIQLADLAIHVKHLQLQGDACLRGVSTDTRSLHSGDLFIALQGPQFNGHNFIAQAKHLGAAAVVVSEVPTCDIPYLLVKNTHQAYCEIAHWYRQQFHIPVIGLTGSVGKTTTKEMIGAILQQHANPLVTTKNFNNTIGVPQTLLQLDSHHTHAVIEMGMNKPGEIARCSYTAEPTVALLLCVAAVHIEAFGTLEAIAREKASIFSGLQTDGWAVLNADDPFLDLWRADLLPTQRVMTFGFSKTADCRIQLQESSQGLKPRCTVFTPNGAIDLTLSLLGEHHVINAAAAAAVATCLNIPTDDIQAGIQAVVPLEQRLRLIEGVNNATIIDDSYSASFKAMQAALDLLAQQPGKRIAILGDMRELGEHSVAFHQQLGEYARKCRIDAIYSYGEYSRYYHETFHDLGEHFVNQQDLIAKVLTLSQPDVTFLVKGSRALRMEHIVSALIKRNV
ncbi:MAG: UDP-N-acetylmuramoyl-tripeptide--D-alanyl-D-alanine ligase [Gammaproteobacteria bacterium]